MPKRGVTGYLLFMNEQRQSVADELRAGEENASVPAVAKIVGRKWKELPEDQKQVYKDRAAERQKELELQHENDDENTQQDKDRTEESGPAPGLPVSSIKKIMTTDDEVKRVSAESVQIMSKATELFLSYVVEKALEEAKKDKRKLIKLPDIENAVRLDPALKATNALAYLKQMGKRKAEALEDEDGEEQTKAPSSKKSRKAAKDPGQTTTITSYLKPQ